MRAASFRVTATILPTDAQNLSIEHCPTSESYLLWSYDLGCKRMYFLLLATPGRRILYRCDNPGSAQIVLREERN